ncbi:Uncharacterised protein [Mycobacterium tuberculosis]|nr:Uncharacterised protein [Mycobacterium tuberculosis]
MIEAAVELVGEEHVAQLGRGVSTAAFGRRVLIGGRVREVGGAGIPRVGHSGVLARVVRAAADDNDARRTGQPVENPGH